MLEQDVYFGTKSSEDLKRKLLVDQEKVLESTKRALMALVVLKNRHAEECIERQLGALKQMGPFVGSFSVEEAERREKAVADCCVHLEKEKQRISGMCHQLLPRLNDGTADLQKVKQVALWSLKSSCENLGRITGHQPNVFCTKLEDEPSRELFDLYSFMKNEFRTS